MTEALFLKQAFINANAPLKNGLGRYIPQLMRITLKFCKESPTSQGVREFIEKEIVDFAKQNPGTAVYLKPRRHRAPVVVAEFLNGERMWQNFDKLSQEEVSQWMDYYRCHSGKNYVVQKKYEFTVNPSIQGIWHPFVNADPQLATANFPYESATNPSSATEHLKALFAQQKNLNMIPEAENEQLESSKQ